MAVARSEIEAVRAFNRFYTKQIGLLREGMLKTPFSLTQARVLYELGRSRGIQSAVLAAELGLDAGYLSRLLTSFQAKGLIKRSILKDDRRVQQLSLTAKGLVEFKRLDARSQAETGELLAAMNSQVRAKLVNAMSTIRESLEPAAPTSGEIVLRAHRPGDIGWLIARHGELYAQEYQWDGSFEGLVAEIAGGFLKNFDAARERCWIAERAGERLGCVLLVKQSKQEAKLRLLLVEPAGRGLGIGTLLVNECIAFAKKQGYHKVTLWTNDILHAARKLYERAGFRLLREEKHNSFGHDLTGQFWELTFGAAE